MARGLRTAVVCLCAGLGSIAAHAEVGKATAGPGEWYLGLSGGGGATWGAERQAFVSQHGEVNFDDGGYFILGLEAGYVLENPSLLFDRIELATELRGQTRDFTRDPASAAQGLVDPIFSATVALGGGFTQVDSDEEEVDAEVRLSFKNTLVESDSHVIVASVEPFYRNQDTDSTARMSFTTGSSFSAERRDNIDADYYGAQVAVEMEKPLTDSISLVGRASAGAYYVDADTESSFAPQIFGIEFKTQDSDSTWGGRFGGALGIKVPLHYAGASLTLLGTVDYLTDVATIDHVELKPGQSFTETGFDDALDVGGKVGLIIPLK